MRYRLILLALLFSHGSALVYAQEAGIRHTGLLGSLQFMGTEPPVSAAKPLLLKRQTIVDLYPGVAVVKQQYIFRNPDTTAHSYTLAIPLAGAEQSASLGTLRFAAPDAIQVLSTHDGTAPSPATTKSVATASLGGNPGRYDSLLLWQQSFGPGSNTTITLKALLRTNQSRIIKGNTSRDGNAMAINLDQLPVQIDAGWNDEIMVRMNEGINLTAVWGVQPQGKVKGDLSHLYYVDSAGTNDSVGHFLVWYAGAPPDFNYAKKVLPLTATLFNELDSMPLELFGDPAFQPIQRNNFALAPTGLTLTGVLYFILFSIPWILLAAIVVFLIRGKKQKKA